MDGELQHVLSSNGDYWSGWDEHGFVGDPSFDQPPHRYRRKPKDVYCWVGIVDGDPTRSFDCLEDAKHALPEGYKICKLVDVIDGENDE